MKNCRECSVSEEFKEALLKLVCEFRLRHQINQSGSQGPKAWREPLMSDWNDMSAILTLLESFAHRHEISKPTKRLE